MTNTLTFRKKVYGALDASDGGKGWDKVIDSFLIALVMLNAAAVVLETVKSLNEKYHTIFYLVEIVSVYIFMIEYILRVWSSVENPKYQGKVGRLKYITTPMALIDIASILPYFLSFGLFDTRILRLFRMLKITRYVPALIVVEGVIYRKRNELLVSLGVIAMMLVIVSSLMYVVENEAQPDKFGSIPETMWWGVATLTTVGYGDVFPITALGKLLSSIIAVLGLGLFALPTGILAAGFSEELTKRDEDHNSGNNCTNNYCQNCGYKQ